ncbi:MAG: hypothetical protein RL308_3574 [Bacteroidota bacterium]|jgi:hypothetical protein
MKILKQSIVQANTKERKTKRVYLKNRLMSIIRQNIFI